MTAEGSATFQIAYYVFCAHRAPLQKIVNRVHESQ